MSLGFDWDGLLAQKVSAPHVPEIKVNTNLIQWFIQERNNFLEALFAKLSF
jgi:hypothetical protein